jgi:RNA polymerase sigma factor (sigma-70 family)
MLTQLQLPAPRPRPRTPPPDAWAVALAYLPLVRRLARDFHRGPWDTDDLEQEGLLAVYCAVAKDDPTRDSFGGLARRAARNRMLDWLRWRRIDDPATGDVATARGRADRWDRADLADVFAAIECLPDRQRFIVREHFGLRGPARTAAVIAVVLGMKRDAVARAQLRALVRVRERLVPAARGPEAARPPCVICGDPDGVIPRGRRTPERLSLARFGLEGVACRRCYIRLYARQRAGSSLGPDVGCQARALARVRKRLGVVS